MTTKKKYPIAQNPLILRCHRLMEAFAKSDDEKDFYIDRVEGFILYVDLDKPEEDLIELEKEIARDGERFVLIPKMTFYETKKIMEAFVNEKVYDIDTKEKLLEIIQSKEARENFLDFIHDHHAELEKWQLFYQERSRIRIIEWLRQNHFEFVFEEDLEFPKEVAEKLKQQLFEPKAGKDVLAARKALIAKAKTYYSTEALNPRPKRGRPPKQIAKAEIEPQMAGDLYTTVPKPTRPFLFIPEFGHGSLMLFSQRFDNEEERLASKKSPLAGELGIHIESLNQKLLAIRNLSNRWEEEEKAVKFKIPPQNSHKSTPVDLEELEEMEGYEEKVPSKVNHKKAPPPKVKAPTAKKSTPKKLPEKKSAPKKPAPAKPIPKKAVKSAPKKVAPKKGPIKKKR